MRNDLLTNILPAKRFWLLAALLFSILLSNCTLLGQGASAESSSIIHIIRSKNFVGSACRTDIIFPNQRAFNLSYGAMVNYKIFSEGEVAITVEVNCPGTANTPPSSGSKQLSIDVKNGAEYYILYNAGSFKEVNKADVQKRIDKVSNIQKYEENPDAPIINRPNGAKNEGKRQGTCWAVSPPGFLITNYHCVENAKEIYVRGIQGEYSTKYSATVLASDRVNDFALIKLDNKSILLGDIPFSIRKNGVEQGEKAYAIGFPFASVMGTEPKLTDGIISSKSGMDGNVSHFQISADVNPGNSGGPLIDEHGNLIGVIVSKSTLAGSAGYAVKAGYLMAFLENVDGITPPEGNGGFMDKSLPEIVSEWKKYIFILEAE